jgi:hypothetical protein
MRKKDESMDELDSAIMMRYLADVYTVTEKETPRQPDSESDACSHE